MINVKLIFVVFLEGCCLLTPNFTLLDAVSGSMIGPIFYFCFGHGRNSTGFKTARCRFNQIDFQCDFKRKSCGD